MSTSNFSPLLTIVKQSNLSINPTSNNNDSYSELLGKVPFWCGDNELHKQDPDYKHTARCCTTHIVGLPRHPATNEEMPLTPFQVDFAIKIIDGRLKFGDAITQMRTPLLIHLNKGRQMGFTEIVLRIILHLCFLRYEGKNVGIIAATNGSLAKKDLRRLARLFKSIPNVVEQWIKSNTLRLVNGTVIEAFAASEEALTGDTNYKCIFMDEAAKWKLVDDEPVFNSILPIVRTNGADLLLVSTPKGVVKKFYQIHEDPQDFELHQYDIHHSIGNLYTKEQVEQMLESATEDPEQEYLCKFKVGRDSIFGTVQSEDMQGQTEWLVEYNEVEDEKDNYNEKEDPDEIHWHDKSVNTNSKSKDEQEKYDKVKQVLLREENLRRSTLNVQPSESVDDYIKRVMGEEGD